MRKRGHKILVIIVAMLMLAITAGAQNFKVASFRQLPSDVSAFINPVRDLNGDDCGLLKIIAPEDFVFSTPLGIVKRVDNVGEIWLYVPRGTKKITIKHAELGVLRDYALPAKVDSHMAYELVIGLPMSAVVVPEHVEPLITTITDTLVVTRVDTIVVQPVVPPTPLTLAAIATAGVGGKSIAPTGGIMLLAMKRHGAFVHMTTNFGSIGTTVGECDKQGYINGEMSFYSGRTRRSVLMINAGAAHQLSSRVALFEGIGYSDSTLAWELAPSEGGGFVKNSGYSVRGFSFEIGAMMSFGPVVAMASVSSIKGKDWYGSVGIGISIDKLIKKD